MLMQTQADVQHLLYRLLIRPITLVSLPPPPENTGRCKHGLKSVTDRLQQLSCGHGYKTNQTKLIWLSYTLHL